MKLGDFILEFNKGIFMTRVGLEWLNENLKPNTEMNWDNPWHRAIIIGKQKAFQAEYPVMKLEIDDELRKKLVVNASTKIH